MVKVMSLLVVAESTVGFNSGVRSLREMKLWCVNSTYSYTKISLK